MATADVSHGVGHREHREAECEGHAQVPDADIGHTGGEHGRTATTEHQHERAKELRGDALRQGVFISHAQRLRERVGPMLTRCG